VCLVLFLGLLFLLNQSLSQVLHKDLRQCVRNAVAIMKKMENITKIQIQIAGHALLLAVLVYLWMNVIKKIVVVNMLMIMDRL
jgi:hypothetical protein